MRATLIIAGVLMSAFTVGARSNPTSVQTIVGSWSGQIADPGGMAPLAVRFGADGRFLMMNRSTNGLPTRSIGHYGVQAQGGGTFLVHMTVESHLPHEVCVQAPGYQAYCKAYPSPAPFDVRMTLVSPDTISLPQGQLTRDPSPALLAVEVPEQFHSAIAAPQVRMPVMPTLHPYVTPGGAGSVGALRADSRQQEYRVCGVNNGTIVHYRDGTVKCVN